MAGQTRYSELTFIGRDSGLARVVGRPLKRFLDVQAAGGVVLLVATAIALIWANSPWSESYFDLWHTKIDFKIGDVKIFGKDLEHFVNDGLMALFFFVVGLEIKRELVTGQLREFRNAMLPAIAALGGMVVPALVFVAFNIGGDGINGWGIPMATDIAFAVGIVSLLGDRIGSPLKIFLLTLAIVDDIGAIAVIALFYTDNLSYSWLLTAVGLLLVIWILRVLRVWYIPIYVLVGVLVWWATFKSGVHATIAGVVLGLMTPAKPLQSSDEARSICRVSGDARHHRRPRRRQDRRYHGVHLGCGQSETCAAASRHESRQPHRSRHGRRYRLHGRAVHRRFGVHGRRRCKHCRRGQDRHSGGLRSSRGPGLGDPGARH